MAVLAIAAAGSYIGGAIITGTVLGMTGASIGWMAGSMLGSALFSETQKGQGPRLSDLKTTGSSYGATIPYVAGHPRIAGQIVWASTKREIANTQSAGGKGGGGSEYTSYTYEVDLLILLSDNQIDGIQRIWSNGEVIWSAIASAGAGSLLASATTPAWSRVTIYTGGITQLPDPDYEATVGTANAPAYRGRGSVFIKSLQLGGGGQIPNLTFEVVADGVVTLTNLGDGLLCHFDAMNGSNVASALGPDMTGGAVQSGTVKFGFSSGSNTGYTATGMNMILAPSKSWRAEVFVYITSVGTRAPLLRLSDFNEGHRIWLDSVLFASQKVTYIEYTNSVAGGSGIGPALLTSPIGLLNNWHHFAFQYNGLTQTLIIYQDGQTLGTIGGNYQSINYSKMVVGGGYVDEAYFRFIDNSDLWGASYAIPTGPFDAGNVQTYAIAPDTVPVADVVAKLCEETGLTTAKFDTSGLTTITRPVRAMAISQVGTVRTVLEMLASVYHFECFLLDKLYFVPRSTSSVATLTFDEFGVVENSGSTIDPLPLQFTGDLEMATQMAISYTNVDNDYQVDTQYSFRLLEVS